MEAIQRAMRRAQEQIAKAAEDAKAMAAIL
jgi:hypothetical protein